MVRADLAEELHRRAETDGRARNPCIETGEAGDLARSMQTPQPGSNRSSPSTAGRGPPWWVMRALTRLGSWSSTPIVAILSSRARHWSSQALKHLKAAVEAGDAPACHLAYLTDRVLVGTGKPRIYGTQYADDGHSLGPTTRPRS
jgi:hypothetical protein